MSESEGRFVPPEAVKPTLNQHGEIVDPNKKGESWIGKKVGGWIAMARLGSRAVREGYYRSPKPGEVKNNLEKLKASLDQAKPFEPTKTDPISPEPTTRTQ